MLSKLKIKKSWIQQARGSRQRGQGSSNTFMLNVIGTGHTCQLCQLSQVLGAHLENLKVESLVGSERKAVRGGLSSEEGR